MDEWLSIKHAEIDIGAIVNRKSCSWHLSGLHEELVLLQVQVAYINKQYSIVERMLDELTELHPIYNEVAAQGFGSFITRMKWNIKHNRGGLYGSAQELALFKDKHARIAVMLAEIAMEQQEYGRALRLYRKLQDNYKISNAAFAYVAYNIALCESLDGSNMKAAWQKMSNIVEKYPDSPTAPRALYRQAQWVAGNVYRHSGGALSACAFYDAVIERYPHSEEADASAYQRAWLTWQVGDKGKAKKMFKKYLQLQPAGAYRLPAKHYIDQQF